MCISMKIHTHTHIYRYIDTGVHGELVLFPQTTGYSNDWEENYGSPERNKYHPKHKLRYL